MGNLADRFNEAEDDYLRHTIPPEFKPFSISEDESGEIQTEPTTERNVAHDQLLRDHNLDPEHYMIIGPVRVGSWQQSKRLEDGNRDTVTLYSHRFHYVPRVEKMDLPALFAAARKVRYKQPVSLHGGKTLVVVWADPQTGKVGSRGGTPELIARVKQVQDKLALHIRKVRPDLCIFIDAGDGVENFENVPAQQFTNDLSLMDQVDIEATMEFETIAIMAKAAPTKVVKVPSNHSAWRRGKGLLGRATDDWGIHIGRRLQQMFKLIGADVEFIYPRPDDLSVAVDASVKGMAASKRTIIGVTHGHVVSRPEAIPRWFAEQVFGAQAVAHADILITGHFHHLRLMPTGRNPFNGRSRWWIQAPTLDNGSDWYRNLRGDDSDPGLLVFEVDEFGFNLQSLTILGADREGDDQSDFGTVR